MQAPLDDLLDLSSAHLGERDVERRSPGELRMRGHHETRRGGRIAKRLAGQRIQTGESLRGGGNVHVSQSYESNGHSGNVPPSPVV